MDANELIEAYVSDVAVRLPRKQRNDVAFELRALLTEELQGKADEEGRMPDAGMAHALLQAFGRPADVAARYRPTLIIIDPADGYHFLRATVIGLALIWSLGLLLRLGQPIASGSDLLGILGQWWGAVVIPSLWWPGVLVVGFGVAAWTRRRWPHASDWKPRAGDRIQGGRAAMLLMLVAIVCGLSILVEPRWLLDTAFNGRAAPAAYEALTYTDAFRQRQAPYLFVLLVLNIPLFIAVMLRGCWSPVMRRVELGLALATCAAMAWTVLDGPVFMSHESDKTVKFLMVLIAVGTLINFVIKLARKVRPSPESA